MNLYFDARKPLNFVRMVAQGHPNPLPPATPISAAVMASYPSALACNAAL
jgi:hypothetical protein